MTDDEAFRTHITALLRMGAVPVSPIPESAGREGQRADIVVIDARANLDTAMARAEYGERPIRRACLPLRPTARRT